MLDELTNEALRKHEETLGAKRKVTITLDSDTVQIVKDWSMGNHGETVAFLCRVAAAHLAAAKGKRDAANKQSRPEDKKPSA